MTREEDLLECPDIKQAKPIYEEENKITLIYFVTLIAILMSFSVISVVFYLLVRGCPK